MSDDFDPREYLLTVDTNTDAIADKLVTEFGFTEGPRSRKYKGVRSFNTTHNERNMWRGYLTVTRTYVGDENNQTWAVDWYPKDGNPKHIHTSGPQHKLLDFLSYFQTSLHTNWMTNRQAIKQAATDKGFDTTYIDNPANESLEFDARDYLLNDPEPKTPEQLFDYYGYELGEGGIYNKFWPVKDGFSLNVGGKHQSAYGNVRTWAAVTDDNGAAYFGQYTVPVDKFAEWLSNADRVIPSVQAAANAAQEVTSAQGYADMQAAWETVFPYEPDAPVQESDDFDAGEYLSTTPQEEEPFDARDYFLSRWGDADAKLNLPVWERTGWKKVGAGAKRIFQVGPNRVEALIRRTKHENHLEVDLGVVVNRSYSWVQFVIVDPLSFAADLDKFMASNPPAETLYASLKQWAEQMKQSDWIKESEDFDPRDYLLSAPADYVVKWTFGPPKPGRHLYRYTRINGVTSEEAALREWQAKMEKDWGWRVGDDKKPHLVKVTRAVIQDRPVQESGPPDEAFTKAMQQATAEFVADERNMVYGGGREEGRRIGDGYDINCGMCEEWAERVRQLYQEATGNDAVEVLDPGNLTGSPDDSLAGHVFLRFNGRFYDSECPQGVFHWNQLPLFLKQMDEAEDFDAREYFLHEPVPTCPSCHANLTRTQVWREIKIRGDRGFKQTGIVMDDGTFHANEDVPEEFRRCAIVDILGITYHCGKCNAVIPRRTQESDDFDAREYMLSGTSLEDVARRLDMGLRKGAGATLLQRGLPIQGTAVMDYGQPVTSVWCYFTFENVNNEVDFVVRCGKEPITAQRWETKGEADAGKQITAKVKEVWAKVRANTIADYDEFVRDFQMAFGHVKAGSDMNLNPLGESEDFDAREYFTRTASVPDMLKAMRYELHPDGAAKVFKGANDRDYMLFVTMRGGQPLDTGIATSIYDLGIYVGKGRDWDCLKNIFSMTPHDMQETLEQAENAIRKGEWTGLGLSINRVTDSLEEPPGDEFDPRDYLMRDEGAALDELGFQRMPVGWTKSGERLWSRTQGTIRIDVHNYGDDEWFVLGWVNNDGKWEKHDIESYYTGKGISLKQVIDNIDASCRGVYEGLEEPPADDFDPRQYFIDSSSVQFTINGKREAWNFGAETRKEIELYNGAASLRLKYLADEWHPRWEFEIHAKVPWKGQFEKLLIKRTCETERLLPKRIEQVLKKADEWYEKNKWGLAVYPLIYGPHGVKDYVGEHPEWGEYVEQNAGDLPTDFENQTEETAAAWKELIFKFRAERNLGVHESEEAFDPRDYLLADKGQALVNRLKELGYKQVQLHVMTDRHATLMMNDPDPEYEDEENGGGIDQTKRVYARNRVKTAVRELMGLATSVYDFSGDGGTDYLFKIADPEHMGLQGRFEAQDNFDPREYMATMPKDEIWRVVWVGTNDGTEYRTKGFPSAEKAMRYVYTSSLFNKADTVKLERRTGNDFNEYDWKEFPVTRDYELIDPDTGKVLIREALVIESEEQDFSARDYFLSPYDEHGLIFLDWLEAVGFDARGENTYELNQWGTRFIVQRYKNGKYRYAIYDENGHKVRGQLVNGPGQLVDLLQQHLGMRLKQESEEPFDAREYLLTKTSDQSVLNYIEKNGFKEAAYPGGVRPRFYAVWEKTIGPYQIAAYRGVQDEKLGGHRWWLEIWDHGRHHGNMGAYWSAENFLPRLQAQVRMKTDWAEHEQSTAANA